VGSSPVGLSQPFGLKARSGSVKLWPLLEFSAVSAMRGVVSKAEGNNLTGFVLHEIFVVVVEPGHQKDRSLAAGSRAVVCEFPELRHSPCEKSIEIFPLVKYAMTWGRI